MWQAFYLWTTVYDCLGRYSLRNNGSVFRHLPYKQFHKNCSYLLLLEKPLPVVVFSHKRLHPYQLFPADYCSSAGTGTLLKSRQFFNGNCQTPMGNGWIRTNVNGFKNHLFCDRLRTPYGHCRLRSCDIELWAQRFSIKLSVQKVHIFNSGQRYSFTAAYGFRL